MLVTIVEVVIRTGNEQIQKVVYERLCKNTIFNFSSKFFNVKTY